MTPRHLELCIDHDELKTSFRVSHHCGSCRIVVGSVSIIIGDEQDCFKYDFYISMTILIDVFFLQTACSQANMVLR